MSEESTTIELLVPKDAARLRLDQFLALRGVYADDQDFDNAMNLIDKLWTQWTVPNSA